MDASGEQLDLPFELASPSRSSSSSVSFQFSSSDGEWCSSPPREEEDYGDWSLGNTPGHDPLSASTKSTRPPKLYAKKLEFRTPPTSPGPKPVNITPITPRPLNPKGERNHGDARNITPPDSPHNTVATITELDVWEMAMSAAIDGANGNIDLCNRNLSYIPRTIGDLSKLVVLGPSLVLGELQAAVPRRQFSRIASAPSTYYAPPSKRIFGRTTTTVPGYPTKSGDRTEKIEAAIELYLGGNTISSIPRELFSLRGLTVLSLRSNRLEYLPPCIANLTALKELNVANNKLRYLPSELVSLNLTSLLVHPNPFIPPPAAKHTDIHGLEKSHAVASSGRDLSPLLRHKWAAGPNGTMQILPPLSELAYRVLLAPKSQSRQRCLPSPAEHGHSSRSSDVRDRGEGVFNWHDYDRDEWAEYDVPSSVWKILETAAPLSSPAIWQDDEERDVINFQSPVALDADATPHKGKSESDSEDSMALMQAATYYPHFCPSPSHQRRLQSEYKMANAHPVSVAGVPEARSFIFQENSTPSFPGPITTGNSPKLFLSGGGASFDGMGPRYRERIARPRTPTPSCSSSSHPGLDAFRLSKIAELHRATPFGGTNATTSSSAPNARPIYPYLRHVEEQYEWVGEIAGVTIAETRLGHVPILWRGCQVGCLAFLDGDAAGKRVDTRLGRGPLGGAPAYGCEGEKEGDGFDIGEAEMLDPTRPTREDAPDLGSGSDSEDSLDLEIKVSL